MKDAILLYIVNKINMKLFYAPTLKHTLNLTNIKVKHEIKMLLLRQPCHFILLPQFFQLFYSDSIPSAPHHKCNTVPDTAIEKVYYISKATEKLHVELVM